MNCLGQRAARSIAAIATGITLATGIAAPTTAAPTQTETGAYSRRIQIAETCTDAERYRMVNDELVWHRAFGRPANAVVLPPGWVLTNSPVPATISLMPDGRTRLDVIITARRAA